ncbi:MAG: DUF4294 domain-containing protein [Polaribacter sp.]|uniref:DUF4294 domain-containing protein n=1 Tax=Polaribacter sp. TaxID=1920175 RepID=UPI003219A6CA
MKNIFYIYVMSFSFIAFSQIKETDSLPNHIDDYIFVKPGDSVVIQLKEISLLPKPKFNSREDIRYYLWFKKKVFKAYPYAKLASERLDSLHARLNRIDSKYQKRRYTKLIQNYIEGEFTDQIKKMTTTEGRILIKLIHRQTGKTAFNNIKGIRSGWKAFWYNTTANVFKLSLKTEYNPEIENEDFLIEYILQSSFRDSRLKPQESKLNFDFIKTLEENKAKINVETYKEMFAKMNSRKKNKKKD